MRRPRYHRWRNTESQLKLESSGPQKILANSAVIITVITAVLYFHGRSLYGGYLSYWGLGSDLFPISTEDALCHGVYAYLWFGIETWEFFGALTLYIVAVYAVAFFLCFNRPSNLIQRVCRPKMINGKQKVIVGDFITIVQWLVLTLFAAWLFILLTSFAHQKGHEFAANEHKRIKAGQPQSKNKFEKLSLVFQGETGQNKNITGYRLATSATLCALCTEDGVQVLPFAKIVSMHIAEREGKKAAE